MVRRERRPREGRRVLSPTHEVRCGACHRVERWSPEASADVLVPGGVRRVESPERAAWQALEDSWEPGARPVVGRCAACGQPLTADRDAPAPRVPWQLELPGVVLQISAEGEVTGPSGTLTRSEARELVWSTTRPAAWYQPARLGQSMFQTGVLLGLLGPLTAFLLAILSLSIFVGPAAEEWRKFGVSVWEALR